MKKLPSSEILSISNLILMETTGLAMAKAGVNVITDEQLKAQAKSGITAGEMRIKGLQQFIIENNVIHQEDEGGSTYE
ncbi:MAG: hypothetical protein CVU84_00655 [Firmicutes bacterium HGW-Firmicutes-1]|jgi:hypothetical protein|nr:MAG: hypothetical protein CVU84_00655 [Firmicutes bacterium HGW-Firmicutes-1]